MRESKPIHHQITDILRERIAAGQYDVGTGLPPELVLVEEFGVSRHTVRSALQRLVADGLIERRAGLGTTVTKRATGGSWLIGSLDELLEYNLDQIELLDARLVPGKDYPQAADLFAASPTGKVFRLVRRLRNQQGEVCGVAQIFTSAPIAARIPRAKLDKVLFIDLIQKHCSVRADRVRQVSGAALADQELAQELDMQVGDPVLRLHRTYTSTDGDPIMLVDLTYRPDRYQHTITYLHQPSDRAAAESRPTPEETPAPAPVAAASHPRPRVRARRAAKGGDRCWCKS